MATFLITASIVLLVLIVTVGLSYWIDKGAAARDR